MRQGSDQGISTCLPAGSQHTGQHSSISSSILPGSQWKASWPPSLGPLPSGCAVPSTDRAGTVGSAFSAWAPAQLSSGYSLHSVQASNSNSNLGHAAPAAAVSAGSLMGRVPVTTAPSLDPSRPPDAFPPFNFLALQAQPSASQSAGMAPSPTQTAPRLSGPGLSYKPLSLGFPLPGIILPSQVAAQLPTSPVSVAEVPALPCGIGAQAFPGLLPHMPMLPGMLNLSSQWPLTSSLNQGSRSQPLPFPPFGYSVSPYPLGYGQMPPQLPLPFQFPTDPQAASTMASAYLPSAVQGVHHLPPNLPYHLPPYPPHPMQALSPSQAHPFVQQYTLPSAQNPLIKQEDNSLAPNPFPPRNLAPEPLVAHRQAQGRQAQLANSSWHPAGGNPQSSGDRHTSAGTHHDKLASTSLPLVYGGSVAKVEPKHSGQWCGSPHHVLLQETKALSNFRSEHTFSCSPRYNITNRWAVDLIITIHTVCRLLSSFHIHAEVKPCWAGPSGRAPRGPSSGTKRQLETSDGSQTTSPGQAGKGNKRCKLGPTEQLRVAVRQILAGAHFTHLLGGNHLLLSGMLHDCIVSSCKHEVNVWAGEGFSKARSWAGMG